MKKKAGQKSTTSHLRNARIKQNMNTSMNELSRDRGDRSISSNKDVLVSSSGLRSLAGEGDYVDERHFGTQKENQHLNNAAKQKSSFTTSYQARIQNSSSHSKKVTSSNKQRRRPSNISAASAPQEWMLGTEKVSQVNSSVHKASGFQAPEVGSQSMQRIAMRKQSSTFENNNGDQRGITSSHKLLPTQSHGAPQIEDHHAYRNTNEAMGGASSLQQPSQQAYELKKQSSLKKISSSNNPLALQISYTKVFVMGDTRHGQLGFSNPNENNQREEERHSHVIARPKMCSYNILIKQIACGEAQTHLLSQDGYVYSMGSNEYGVLGLGKSEHVLKSVTQPQLVPGLQCVMQIAAGRAHSIALDVRRDVYAWGRSDNGAIGLRMATPEHQSQPMPISLNLDTKDQVIQVDCGLEHSCFVTADGHVFGCGEGEYGQLGVGYVSLKEYRPIRAKIKTLAAGDYVTRIACGAYHTLYLTRFKQIFAAGANNLGQLGVDSLETQLNSPTLVESLVEESVLEVACGESSFAITGKGDLYVWGLYNMSIHRVPILVTEIDRPVASVSQSFYGVSAAVDVDEQAYYWHNQLDAQTQNVMQLAAYPTVVRQMKRRQVKKVFTGKDLVFGLGEDVNASTSNLKDSQTSSGLQEIPERDEKSTGLGNSKLPILNLSKLHKGSTGSLHKKQSREKIATAQSFQDDRTQAKSRSQTGSRSRSKSNQRSTSAKKIVIRRITGSRSGSNQRIQPPPQPAQKAQSKSPSVSKQRASGAQHSSKAKKRASGARSASNSEPKQKRSRVVSRSKSGGSKEQHRTRSGSQQKHGKIRLANKAQNATQVSLKSSKSAGGRPKNKKPASSQLEKQVARKFQDLSQRLETDKTEVVNRLAQLSQKVSKIGKMSKKQQQAKRKSKNHGNSLIMVQEQHLSPHDVASDVRSGSYDLASDDNAMMNQRQPQMVIAQNRAAHNTFDAKKPAAGFNMFNCASELAQDPELISQVSKPQLFYSPQQDTVDIRSPGSGNVVKTISTQNQAQPDRLRVDVSDSPRAPAANKETRFRVPEGHQKTEIVSDPEPAMALLAAHQTQHANTGPPTIVPNDHHHSRIQSFNTSNNMRPQAKHVRSPPVHSPTTAPQIPPGYVAVRSPSNQNGAGPAAVNISNQRGSRSPTFKRGQGPTYEQQLINQLREQIDYLERQTARLKEEKLAEQMRAQDWMNRYEEARKSNLQVDVHQEGTLRSLESQLRTCKLEKSDLQIRLADAERRVRDLEDKVAQLGASKRKEDDYLNKLGQSHEALRLEKARTKDLQNQTDMLTKTLQILETTVETVKRDKELLEKENARLKEYLQAKDLEVDVNAYRHMVGPQAQEILGRDDAEEMDRRSRSLGMRGSQHGNDSKNDTAKSQAKHDSNASLAEKHLERSQERPGSRNARPSSQLSQSQPAGDLMMIGQFQPEQSELPPDEQAKKASEHSSVMDKYVDHDLGKKTAEAPPAAGGTQPDHYTVQVPPINSSQPNTNTFQTKDSRETGRFVEPSQVQSGHQEHHRGHIFVEEDHRRSHEPLSQASTTHDPRIQKLLSDARELQQKHKTLMSHSPLRLKANASSTERMPLHQQQNDLSRNSSLSRPRSSLRDTSEQIFQQSYPQQQSAVSQKYPPPSSHHDRSNSPAYEAHDASPLRRKSHQPQPDHRSSTSPLRHDDVPRHFVQSMNDARPVSQEPFHSVGNPAIRPYYEPPSQSEGQSTNRDPAMAAAYPSLNNQTAPIQELSPDFEDDDQSRGREPVRSDFDADELRQRAGIKPKSSSQGRQKSQPPSNGIKDLVKSAYMPKEQRHPHFPFDPELDGQGPPAHSRSQGPVKPKPDNRDYIAAVRKDLDENPPNSHLPRKPSPHVDRQKMEDQYNQKLLDDIEKLAQRAKKSQQQPEEQPRVNKFKRTKSASKENSMSAPSSSPIKPLSQKSGGLQQPLPAQIFNKEDSRDAYQNKLNQLKRNGASSADNPSRRQPSNSASKRHSQRRPLSKEEDEDETRQMLVEPKRPAGSQPWTNGLTNQRNDSNEKPTAQNNSFLARREALQNRLKKL